VQTLHERAATLARAARLVTLACGYVLVAALVMLVVLVGASAHAAIPAGVLALVALALVYARAFLRGAHEPSPSFEALGEFARAGAFLVLGGYALYALGVQTLAQPPALVGAEALVSIAAGAGALATAFEVPYASGASCVLASTLVFASRSLLAPSPLVLGLRLVVWIAVSLVVSARYDGREPAVYWRTRPEAPSSTHLHLVALVLEEHAVLTARMLALSAWTLYGSSLMLPLAVPLLVAHEAIAVRSLRLSPLTSRATGDAYLSRTLDGAGSIL